MASDKCWTLFRKCVLYNNTSNLEAFVWENIPTHTYKSKHLTICIRLYNTMYSTIKNENGKEWKVFGDKKCNAFTIVFVTFPQK